MPYDVEFYMGYHVLFHVRDHELIHKYPHVFIQRSHYVTTYIASLRVGSVHVSVVQLLVASIDPSEVHTQAARVPTYGIFHCPRSCLQEATDDGAQRALLLYAIQS